MKNSSRALATAVFVTTIVAGVWLLVGVAAVHPKEADASRSDFHCSASSKAPSRSAKRASGRLVPHTPSQLALCRYGRAPAYPLKTFRLVTNRKTVHRLVRGLNALPTVPPGGIACPADNGSEIVVYAMYKRSSTRIVHVELSGCLIARRRGLVRWDLPSGGRFIRVLRHLTR